MSETNPMSNLSPYITVDGAVEAITFYKKAFGAVEQFRLTDPADGRIGHAEITVEGMTLMLSDEYPDFGARGPNALGGSPVKLHLYVENVDEVFARAVEHGATELRAVKDEFYGDRTGTLTDPFGHTWMIATHQEDISAEELQKRWADMMNG